MLYLFDANAEQFKKLDEMRVTDQETWAHVAVTRGHVYVRELNAMTVFRWEDGE